MRILRHNRKDKDLTTERTPENAIVAALEKAQLISALRFPTIAGSIMRSLGNAGFTVEDALSPGGRTYSLEDVSRALNAAADELSEHEYESEATIAQDDAVNLLVSAALHLLEHPGDGLDDVIIAQYADVEIGDWELQDGEEMPERGSERWNELLVAKVRGWIE